MNAPNLDNMCKSAVAALIESHRITRQTYLGFKALYEVPVSVQNPVRIKLKKVRGSSEKQRLQMEFRVRKTTIKCVTGQENYIFTIIY
jgi:hypothetical protein